MLLRVIWLILFCVAEAVNRSETIYHYLPERSLSYCSRKLNISDQVGCSSQPGGSAGIVWIANDTFDVLRVISDANPRDTVLVMDLNLFTNTSLMNTVRSTRAITGILVFAPATDATPPAFSESSTCPNALASYYGPQRQCNVTPPWNPSGSAYSSIDWPFPVVLVQDPHNSIKMELLHCFSLFNANPTDDTRCAIEVNNYMSAIGSTTVCSRRQDLMSLQLFAEPRVFCDELTGLNIVLGVTNTSHFPTEVTAPDGAQRAPNSSLLVLTRMDSRSMFERSGFGSQGVLPSVAVLLSTAVHLKRQPAFKNSQLKRDVFFAFLDNEAYDFMGSGRLNYDLTGDLLAQYTGHPLGWNHVYGMIELGELGLSVNHTVPNYFMLTDLGIYNRTSETTDRLMDRLTRAAERNGQLRFSQAVDSQRELPLPPTASLQSLLRLAPFDIAHLLLSDYVSPPMANTHFESLLDTRWPPMDYPTADESLLNLANSLADAIHQEVTLDSSPLPTNIISPSPGELMECFVYNVNCSLLRPFLNPTDMQFLASLGTPIPTQTYLPLGKLELKLSHVVNVLLMGLAGELTETAACPENTKDRPYVYLMGYYNGSEHCYQTFLDLASRFVLFLRGEPMAPAWVRSRLASSTRFLRWYRSSSAIVDHVSLALGILLIVLTTICALRLRHLMNIHAHRPVLEVTERMDSMLPTTPTVA